MNKFLCFYKNFNRLLLAVAILVGIFCLPMTVQAATSNPLLQGLSDDNPSVYGTGQMDDEVLFKKGLSVVIEEQGKGRARAVHFAGYIPPGSFAYRAMHLKSGHLIIDGYDCQLFNGQFHPLFYKQYDVDLDKRQWRVLVIHQINSKNWGIYRMDCVPQDQSYVPMEDHIWQTIMKLVPADVIEELRSSQ